MSSSVDPPHSYLFQLSFVTGLTGFYLWDWGNSIKFDLDLVFGRYPLRLNSGCYVLMRLLLAAAIVTYFAFQQGCLPIDCRAAWIVSVILCVFTATIARATYACRAVAVWDHRPSVSFPILVLWVALNVCGLQQIGTFKFLDVNLHQERWICVPIGSDKFYATCFLGFCIFFDTIIAALIVSKLYRTSKEIDVPLLSIVFRDAWVFGVVSMAPGVASLLTIHLGGRAAAMVVCMPLHLVIDVLLASYAYRATFQAGTKMLPAGSKSENMVLNGEILNAEELRQLAFRMGSAVATGEEFHRYGASASDPCSREHAYLPGKLSRVQHDPLPPFSTYTYPPSRLSLQGRHNRRSSYMCLPARPEAAAKKEGDGVLVSVDVEARESTFTVQRSLFRRLERSESGGERTARHT